jgi:hypothetical protein
VFLRDLLVSLPILLTVFSSLFSRVGNALQKHQLDLGKLWLLCIPCSWNWRYYLFLFTGRNLILELFWSKFYMQQPSKDGIRTVILCHTRELAAQTTRECKKMAKGSKFRIKLMTKELLRNTDFTKLPCDILISTPRRLQLCICKKKKKIDLSRWLLFLFTFLEEIFLLAILILSKNLSLFFEIRILRLLS